MAEARGLRDRSTVRSSLIQYATRSSSAAVSGRPSLQGGLSSGMDASLNLTQLVDNLALGTRGNR